VKDARTAVPIASAQTPHAIQISGQFGGCGVAWAGGAATVGAGTAAAGALVLAVASTALAGGAETAGASTEPRGAMTHIARGTTPSRANATPTRSRRGKRDNFDASESKTTSSRF
jgi:hypothetical protein